jgi:YqjK-like protein
VEIAAQRALFGQHMEVLRSPLSMADRGMAAVRYIKSHPALAASASVGLLAMVKPNRIGKWLQGGWVVWNIVRKLSGKSTI